MMKRGRERFLLVCVCAQCGEEIETVGRRQTRSLERSFILLPLLLRLSLSLEREER